MKERNEKRLKSFAAGLAVGGILAGGGVYATTVSAGNVSYSNSSSGLNATNAQGVANSLYQTSKNLKSTNDTLTYLHYYTLCHKTNIHGSIFSKEKKNLMECFPLMITTRYTIMQQTIAVLSIVPSQDLLVQ